MSRAQIIPPESATIAPLRGRTISVLGYGSQGSAHALNLRESGLDVLVAQRAGGSRYEQARRDGFDPVDIPTAAARGDLLVFALPDDAAGAIYRDQIAPHVRAGQTLGFIHGFVIHYEQITPPADVDVVMVAPKAQGRGVRSEFVAGRGVLSLIAVHQDATGGAFETALAWAAGIGSHRAGLVKTTFADETESDLFGEQAVLCGGLSALIRAGFDTLVAAGYPEELAYFECCHEVKLLADLIYEHGIAGMRERISSTARYGDVTRGPRVVDEHVRETMRTILNEIRSGAFAREMLADHASGASRLRELCEADREHLIEAVGRRMRALMWGADDPSAGDG